MHYFWPGANNPGDKLGEEVEHHPSQVLTIGRRYCITPERGSRNNTLKNFWRGMEKDTGSRRKPEEASTAKAFMDDTGN